MYLIEFSPIEYLVIDGTHIHCYVPSEPEEAVVDGQVQMVGLTREDRMRIYYNRKGTHSKVI